MARAANFPAYYLPPGMELPSHVGWPRLLGPQRLKASASPDGLEGLYWGPGWDDALRQSWTRTRAGWWILWTGGERPEHFARLSTMPGEAIPGTQPDHRWLVPQLLRWDPEALLACAVPEVLRDGAWLPPQHLIGILEQLRAMALCQVQPMPAIKDQEAIDLAVSVLQLNYHISLIELEVAGWMTTRFLAQTIEAAAGVLRLTDILAEKQAELAALRSGSDVHGVN
jgi:hypothetical protein